MPLQVVTDAAQRKLVSSTILKRASAAQVLGEKQLLVLQGSAETVSCEFNIDEYNHNLVHTFTVFNKPWPRCIIGPRNSEWSPLNAINISGEAATDVQTCALIASNKFSNSTPTAIRWR